MTRELLENFIEIEPLDRADFLKVKETLTRIGLPGRDRTLHQICYILHKRGKYYIVSHIELYRLDGRDLAFTEEEMAYRDAVVELLLQWKGLNVRIKNWKMKSEVEPRDKIKVIHFDEKGDWNLVQTYKIGTKKAGS